MNLSEFGNVDSHKKIVNANHVLEVIIKIL